MGLSEDSVQIETDIFNAKKLVCTIGGFLSFKLTIDTNEIDDVYGAGDIISVKKIDDLEIFTKNDVVNIHKLLDWILDRYKNVKTGLKMSYVLTDGLNGNVSNRSYKVNMFYDIQTNQDIVKVNMCNMAGLKEEFLSHIMISRKQNNEFCIDYVIDSFHFNTVLKNHEYSILKFLVQGFTSDEIAELLHLSPYTVNGYKKQLNDIFQAENVYQLIRNAKEKKII